MIIPLFELTSCATLEKKVVPAYQQACQQGESAACDDATQRLAKYVEEADAAALQQKKIWRKQTLDFIAVLDTELETASCYHDLITGNKAVSGNGIRGAYIPSDAKNTCSDAVQPTKNTDDGVESQYIGTKTGQKIICAGNRHAVPECTYKDEKMVYLTTPQVGSNTLFCKSVKEAISTFRDIDSLPKISEFDFPFGYMTRKEIRFDDKEYYKSGWDATIDCYIMDPEIFCEAKGSNGYTTTSLACPALIGLLSDDWMPHQEIIRALSEEEIDEIRTFISDNKQQEKKVGEQVATTTKPVVDDSLDYVSAPPTLSSSAEQCPSWYYQGLWGIYQTSTGLVPAYNKKTEQFDFVSVSPGDICYDGPYPSIVGVSIVHGSTTLPLIRYEDRHYEYCDCFPLPAEVLRFDPPTFVVKGQVSSGPVPPRKFAVRVDGTIYPISLDREIYRLDGIDSSTPFVMESTQAPKVTLAKSGLEVTDDNAIGMQAFALVKHSGNGTIDYIPLDIARSTAQYALFSLPPDIASHTTGYYAVDRNNNKSVTVDPTGKKLVDTVKQ